MSVEELGSNKSTENGKGSVYVVDPNPPNNEIIPPEDMFIYVKFSAYPRNRVTYNGDGFSVRGVEDEVNFISTSIKYDTEGKLNPNPQETYATTDWTNISSFRDADTKSGGILEGFGIKSINIKYNASLVPVVDITFTDVRGSALFDVLADDDILSPYSIFFKMPYPVFKLSVKGYFGQNVEYCLHMTNWTSNFDGSSGNFDITANFLGFQQAFLNDMVIGNIIGVINTEEGYKNLNNIYDRTQSNIGLSSSGVGKSLKELRENGQLNIRKLDDFFVKISKLKVDAEVLKTELDSFKTLKFLNGKVKILKELRTFIGKPLNKEPNKQSNDDGTSKNYLEINNSKSQIITSNINDSVLQIRKNYFSIRDFLLINVININNFKNYINTLNDVLKKYNEYISDDNNKEYKNTESLEKLKNKVKDKIKGIGDSISSVTNYLKTPEDKGLISLFNIGTTNDEDWKRYIIQSQIPNGNLITDQRFSLVNVLESMYTESSEIYLKNNYNDNELPINNEFDLESFKLSVQNREFYNESILPSTVVAVVDFREIRSLVENEIQDLEKIIKLQQEIVQVEINEELFNKSNEQENSFKPTIRNCFEVLANNTQAMVETIYDITKESEKESISGNRKQVLSSYSTDIPDSVFEKLNGQNKGIAWPSIYEKTPDGEKEIYIGSIAKSNRDIFPEYDFVERVFENLVSKRETLEQITKSSTLNSGLDTDNWFPINPIDYSENPFIRLRTINSEEGIKEYFIEQMLLRLSLLRNYSIFDSTGAIISDYSKLDALNAYETLKINNITVLTLSKIIEKIKNERSSLFSDTSTIGSSKYFKQNIVKTSDIPTQYYIDESKQIPKIGGFNFGVNYNNPSINYILLDDSGIVNNSKKLWNSVQQSNEYSKIINSTEKNKEEKSGKLFYKTFYDSTKNLYTNNLFNVWDDSVAANLFKSNKNTFDNKLKSSKLTDIDVLNFSGDTIGKYLNRTYFAPNTSEVSYEEFFTNSQFYSDQTLNGRGYLLLSTLPFRDFTEGFLNSVFPNNIYNGARIIELPKIYIYYLGSLLWRSESVIDTISWVGKYSTFQTPKENYPNLISYNKIKGTQPKAIEAALRNLPISVKNKLINEFKSWVDVNFNSTQSGKFESEMENYVSDAPTNIESTKTYLIGEFTKTTKLIVLNPNIFEETKFKNLLITPNDVDVYISKFAELFSKKSEENSDTGGKNTESEEKKPSDQNKDKIKLQIYNYFKNINDKWVSDTQKSFNVCGGDPDKNLIQYFRFIDRGWRDIGNDAVINLNSFLSLGSNQDTSVYFFMSKLLRDSNFLFQILPNYINYKNKEEVSKIFKPMTTIEKNDSSGPVYCCIYVGGASQVLDIKETSNYYFKSDGFSFKNGQPIPPDIADNKKASDESGNEYSLVAFRVAFGAQNQTVFKSVSLNQQEHKETGEYFRALSDLVDKRGGTQKTYQGTDLLRLFKTRSYTCQVEAMGCMNIQPLMYFDLQNVPFFNGAYLITSVSHSISPNTMSTSFQGVRQSKYISPPTTSITADIDIDLNATNEIPKIEFTNLSSTNPIYSIGVNPEIADQPFDFVNNITIANLNILGVDRTITDKITNIQAQVIQPMISADIITNSEVSMFFANILANSNNFANEVLDFSNGNYSESEVKFSDTDTNFPNKTKRYQISSVVISDSDINYFTYTPSTSANTETAFSDKIAYNFKNTDSELNEFTKVEFNSDGKIKTDLKNLKYYNIFEGDAYMYRPTGFIYAIGRKQYFDLIGGDAINNPQKYNTPTSGDYQSFVTPFKVSILVWKNLKDQNDKTASEYSTEKINNRIGSFSTFDRTITAVQSYKGAGIEKSAKAFQKVLETFRYSSQPLIDFFNP
jgi:hypothetical protein